jgi:hypothetical protein
MRARAYAESLISIEIPRNLYEQALNVFEWAGEIARRHAYEEVCAPPSA